MNIIGGIKGYNHIKKKPIYYLFGSVQKHNNLVQPLKKEVVFDHPFQGVQTLMSHFKLKELEHKSAVYWKMAILYHDSAKKSHVLDSKNGFKHFRLF